MLKGSNATTQIINARNTQIHFVLDPADLYWVLLVFLLSEVRCLRVCSELIPKTLRAEPSKPNSHL